MSIIAIPSQAILKYKYNWGDEKTLNKKNIKKYKNDTLVLILNNNQKQEAKLIEPYVIFKSKMAVNYTPGHGKAPRNTVYILEFSDDEQA